MQSLRSEDPRSIGTYRLLGRLGGGGMGRVYAARSDRGRVVAVKTIQPALANQPDFRRRFAHEIEAARRVGGRWTAAVLDADPEAETPWVATAYIAGPTLRQVVAEDYGALPERSLRFLAAALVRALRDIHATGLIHRDLKPSNIILATDGPRVIDFGIARALDAVTGEGITNPGSAIGSPGFMSPEQVRGRGTREPSDVFSLGAVLAYAATGQLPFGHGDSGAHAVMFRILEEEPDLSAAPDGLRELIEDCLRKDPARRPTVDELLERTHPDALRQGSWLPAEVLERLAEHAIRLLNSEQEPATHQPPAGPSRPAASPAPAPPGPYAAAPPSSFTGVPAVPPPGAPGAPGAPGRPGPRRRPRARWLPTALASAAVLAAISVVAAVTLSGGGRGGGDGEGEGQTSGGPGGDGETDDRRADPTEDTTPIGDGYIGAWQGEYGAEHQPEWRALWFEIHQGQEGESVGTATVTYIDTMCVYDIQLDSFDGQLNFTETADHSVPEEEVSRICRDDDTVQSLKLTDGLMRWTNGDQQATLSSAEGGDAAVPDTLAGTSYTFESNSFSFTQGAVDDYVVTISNTQITCNGRLAQTEDERILVSPFTGTNCPITVSSWWWSEADGLMSASTEDGSVITVP
ncbi:serine/threonine protein kinase [Streptomyces sp. 6N223]|uniref:serine/threonine protein kinase n=1 Tax=Streptomyces sp. 6N223 TaxID=3457412 RepID=UPI003FD53205